MKSDAEWRESLTPEQYRVLRGKGTEPAFTGAYWDHSEEGTYLCAGCGLELFASAQKLSEELVSAQRAGSLMEKLLFYSRLNLLIIDELGYMPVTREQANLLFQLISIRYERGSTILTSNYVFDEWGRIFDDHVVASAIIDRLVHHAHIFPINGSSWRIKDKLKRGAE